MGLVSLLEVTFSPIITQLACSNEGIRLIQNQFLSKVGSVLVPGKIPFLKITESARYAIEVALNMIND